MISPSSGSCPHPNCSVTSSALSEAPTYPLVSIQLPFTPDPVLQPPVYPYTNDPQRPASSAFTTPQLVTSAPGALHLGVLLPPHFPSERSGTGHSPRSRAIFGNLGGNTRNGKTLKPKTSRSLRI
ncbi:hypothetical protein C8R41DRAFT_927279 [Lentinula lateritia]|uniref:Uncharacterized protein n=1 Tax=Lentinula lateritia TaxID=40482 RepID=A0ABQ8UWB0_9AGAR|nr:hypothetical protein C8R41DRAFT_927279 [Lentinula lateritia]